MRAPGGATGERSSYGPLAKLLGVRFQGKKGTRFFHSTLVQTLFYGVFSAWVLWARQSPPPTGGFDWRPAVRHLRDPVLRALSRIGETTHRSALLEEHRYGSRWVS